MINCNEVSITKAVRISFFTFTMRGIIKTNWIGDLNEDDNITQVQGFPSQTTAQIKVFERREHLMKYKSIEY